MGSEPGTALSRIRRGGRAGPGCSLAAAASRSRVVTSAWKFLRCRTFDNRSWETGLSAEGRRLKTVEAIYERLAPIYDLIYGVTLEPGRRRAMARLAPASGESILEIGVGTGLSAMAYPPGCRVVAIDLSAHMIGRARARFVRRGVHHVTLCRMDAARLAFPDACFDAIYAAYVMNVVRDPVTVVRDMIRVCRPSGRIVFLNHFDRADGSRGGLDGFLGRLASRAGVDWHVDLPAFLHAAGLTSLSIEPVNVPRVSSVVVCRKPMQPVTG